MNYEQLVTAIDVASQALLGGAAKAFNQALVLRNSLIGAHLIEFEQSGQDRAHTASNYSNLAADSRGRGLKGLGMSMLKNCRRFYRLYPHIRQSLPGQFAAIPARALDNQLFVSRYLVALPSAEELRQFIENDREAIESSMREPGSAHETDP